MTTLKQTTTERLITFKMLKDSVISEYSLRVSLKKELATKLFSMIIKRYRYDLIRSHDCYKIITNGYGTVKWIELEDGTRISCHYLLDRLEQLMIALDKKGFKIKETKLIEVDL